MDRIKKAIDVLGGDCSNPIIKADMVKVLREQFTRLENSFDASCNHSNELKDQIAKLMANSNGLKLLLEQALDGLDWYREAHPEDESQIDDEFRSDCGVFLNYTI